MSQQIPDSKQALFWSSDIAKLDPEKHQRYIVHQVLQYGDVEDFRWLQKLYTIEEIKMIFLRHPRCTYQPASFNFVKKFLLKIEENVAKENYVQAAR